MKLIRRKEEMKKIFHNAEIEMISFEMIDIITTSGTSDPFEGEDDKV